MTKSLVIVESPAKAKTINKFLGSKYTVKSSVGHIKDLPIKELGVDIENGFEPKYVPIKGKLKVIRELKSAASKADEIYLAPDPDREGEAIAWHIASELNTGKPTFRVTFNEITKQAVLDAFEHVRKIDQAKVDAQQARRILDRLVGYKISPLLWKYIRKDLSAGRVQSVALKLICDRERERLAFKPEEYWSITANLRAELPPDFKAELIKTEGRKAEVKNETQAKSIVDELQKADFIVQSVTRKEKKRHPVPPFITSTLQQEASRHFGFGAKRTMMIAQQLYEGIELGKAGLVGLITYMRTDSTRVASTAISHVRDYIKKTFGDKYLPEKPNYYRSAKSAQEAHEAIRPTMLDLPPEAVAQYLDSSQLKLYSLIWKRFLASQMESAVYDTVQVDISAGHHLFRANGSVLIFDGFLAVYIEKEDAETNGNGKEKQESESKDVLMPPLTEKQKLQLLSLVPEQHFTKPPARYTEASLVRELEKLGIGRPSTYATIMSKIEDRNYTYKEGKALVPTELGFVVTDVLVRDFPEIVDVKFTAQMESELDEIEEKRKNWRDVLKEFYIPFEKDLKKANNDMRVADIPTDDICEACGSPMIQKWSKKGGWFLACTKYPDCKQTKSISVAGDGKRTVREKKHLDEKCPECGKPLIERQSRFGKFIACSGFPECRYIKKDKPDIPCPREGCDGKIVRKIGKGRRGFYACTKYPECNFTAARLSDIETAEVSEDDPDTPS